MKDKNGSLGRTKAQDPGENWLVFHNIYLLLVQDQTLEGQVTDPSPHLTENECVFSHRLKTDTKPVAVYKSSGSEHFSEKLWSSQHGII